MPKQSYIYEIYLSSPNPKMVAWQDFCFQISKLLGPFSCPKLLVRLEEQIFHFYLLTYQPLPSGIGSTDFMLKPVEPVRDFYFPVSAHRFFLNKSGDDLLSIVNHLSHKSSRFKTLAIRLYALRPTLCSATITYSRHGKICTRRLALSFLPQLLAVDFNKFPNYAYKKFPKYLSSEKIAPFLVATDDQTSSLLQVDTFPFNAAKTYLNLDAFDFNKHSLVLGGSGSGKSRFLSLLIDRIYHNYAERYKVVVIDPHDAIYRDLTTIPDQKLINFSSPSQSIDLFKNSVENVGVAVELLLELFQSLMRNNYNSRLERVLRFSSQLLLIHDDFSFLHLRELLLDVEYRNQLLNSPKVPSAISEFFLTDFNILKTQSYDLAIAPIIAFLDEMQIVPALNSEIKLATFSEVVEQNFLSLISLNQLQLGGKMTQVIAGLVLQQIFLLAKSATLDRELIVIVDEVAVVEHPILARFLSELRKYRVAVILAGQYFSQISSDLQAAVFANVTNYYLFRVSRSDANLLARNLDLTLKNSDTDAEAKFLSSLNLRECVARLSFQDKLQPAFKAKTLDFIPPPYVSPTESIPETTAVEVKNVREFHFSSTASLSLEDLMQENTTNRKNLKEEYDRETNFGSC